MSDYSERVSYDWVGCPLPNPPRYVHREVRTRERRGGEGGMKEGRERGGKKEGREKKKKKKVSEGGREKKM